MDAERPLLLLETCQNSCLKSLRGVHGAPGEIRTPDLTLRRRSLYPAELRARSFSIPYFGSLRCSQPTDGSPVHWPVRLASRCSRISSITDWMRALAPSMPARTACRSRAGLAGLRVEAQ